jgi:hypothetical protein
VALQSRRHISKQPEVMEHVVAHEEAAVVEEREAQGACQDEWRCATASRAARAADLQTATACAAKAARRTKAVAIQHAQEAARLQEELEATLELVCFNQEELGHTAQSAGHCAPPVDAVAHGAHPPPQELPTGDTTWRWVS